MCRRCGPFSQTMVLRVSQPYQWTNRSVTDSTDNQCHRLSTYIISTQIIIYKIRNSADRVWRSCDCARDYLLKREVWLTVMTHHSLSLCASMRALRDLNH